MTTDISDQHPIKPQTYQEVLEAHPDIHPDLKEHVDRLIESETSSQVGQFALTETDGIVIDNKPSIQPSDSRHLTRLDTILSTPLAVGTIDTYAETAVSDLINLTNNVVIEFADTASPDATYSDGGALEDAAFRHFGLPSIDENLDYISKLSQDIKNISTIIERVNTKSQNIVPPDALTRSIVSGSGEGLKVKNLLDRARTLLLILKQDHDIDIYDPEQVKIVRGTTTDKMMRKEPYFSVEIPGLSRTVLICDEEGNATFVIDTEKLQELQISTERLIHMTKDELNTIIEEHAGFGRRIIQTDNWVDNISDNLDEIQTRTSEQTNTAKKPRSYLTNKEREQLSPGEMLYSARDLGNTGEQKGMFDVSSDTIRKVANTLGIKGQEVIFGGAKGIGYDVFEVNDIRDELYRRNLIERTPVDRLYSANSLSNRGDEKGMFDVGPVTIRRIVEDLGIKGQKVNFRSKIVYGYDVEQVKMIEDELIKQGKIQPSS